MSDAARHNRYVEIVDTTLRDGEQTPGVAFTPAEKREIAQVLISKIKIDRLEIASARVSDGEAEGVKAIVAWADKHDAVDKLEILGFVDGGKSIDWIANVGVRTINMLTKGSEDHCRIQLRKTPQQHFDAVLRDIDYATEKGLKVNVYLEDWSRGMLTSFSYVYNFISELISKTPVNHIMLPDTLGVLNPPQVAAFMECLYSAFPDVKFDFHGHNDYDLVTANSLAAIQAGIYAVHSTVNGLGERTGNQPLAPLVVNINDMTKRKTRVVEKNLQYASTMIETISGKRCSWNTPVVGSDVFTQTCGVHADGDKKGNLYANKLLPERFSRSRKYALGKLSGKASVEKNLEEIGLELDEESRAKLLNEIIRLGDKKKNVTAHDLPFIIADILRSPLTDKLTITHYKIESSSDSHPSAKVEVLYSGQTATAESSGDGGFDAFVKALRKAVKKFGLTVPPLFDYEVRIPPGGKTDALVETTISWSQGHGKVIVTTGVDTDQLVAGVKATEKLLNLML